MNQFIFTEKVKETFSKLEQHEQNRIVEKLQFLKDHHNISSVIKRIKYMDPATHRLRIGQNRLLLQLVRNDDSNHFFRILKIGHRREVYR